MCKHPQSVLENAFNSIFLYTFLIYKLTHLFLMLPPGAADLHLRAVAVMLKA